MRTLGRLTLVEMKLFIREPITMFFTFALPLLFLFVMGGVFGKMTNGGAGDFHGLSAMAFYTPAYIALVLTSVGIVGTAGASHRLPGKGRFTPLPGFVIVNLAHFRGAGPGQSGHCRYRRHPDSCCRGFCFSCEPAAKSVARHPRIFSQRAQFYFPGTAAGSGPAHIPGSAGGGAGALFRDADSGRRRPAAGSHDPFDAGSWRLYSDAARGHFTAECLVGSRLELDGIRDYGRDSYCLANHGDTGHPPQFLRPQVAILLLSNQKYCGE